VIEHACHFHALRRAYFQSVHFDSDLAMNAYSPGMVCSTL